MTKLLAPNAKQQFFTNSGVPAAGYRLYVFASGSTTPATTHQNRAGTVANSNPITLDARGEATIYLTAGVVYDFTLKTDNDALVWTREDVTAQSGDADAVEFTDSLAPTYLKTVSDMLQGQPVPITRWIDPTKLSDIRSGTSTYDASTDINDALQAYRNLIVPGGLYLIGSTLLIPDRTTLVGEGWSAPYSSSAVQAPRGSVFKLASGADCDMFRQDGKATRYSIQLRDFAIDGDGANQTSAPTADATYSMYQFNRNGFFFEALYNSKLENLFWYNLRGAGVALHGDATAGMTNVFLNNCHGYNARTYNIYCEGSLTDLRINGGDFGFGRVANLRLTSSATVNGAVFWSSQCQDITDANTHIDASGAVVNAGILIAGSNNKLVGCRSEGNAGHGVKIVGDDNKLSDCTLYYNAASLATTGLFDGVNDLGANNLYEGLKIQQSTGAPHALRKAIKLESGHAGTRIIGCQIRRVGANAANVALPVDGLSWATSDRSDFSWATGEVKAYQGVAQSIGTTATKVQFRTETADVRSEWDTTNDQFTAAEAGIYRIDASVNIANATDTNSFIVAIYKNAAEYRRLGQQRAGAAAAIQIGGGLEMKLEAGDIIDVRAICGTASNTNVGAALTWIEITQING